MPTSSSDQSPVMAGVRQRCHGFTLLELMMVLLLIGLMAGAALTLDFAGSASSQQHQAEMLAQQFKLASLEAVQSGSVWALDFFRLPVENGRSATGYRWLYNDGSRWQAADPQALDAKTSETILPAALELQLSVEGSALEPELQQALQTANGKANTRFTPEILLLPTREFTAFTALLCASNNKGCDVAVNVDALGRITMQAGNAR